ncbi:MAG: class I SAM-dependent methyltransferase [Candidatus Latescibacterota bacterium]
MGRSPSPEAQELRQLVHRAYSSDAVVARYRARVSEGLRVWEATVAARCFPAGARVLAVGCGAGREVFGLEALGFSVCGTDISPELLEAARAIAAERGSRARFERTDGAVLPCDSGAFDVVILWSQVLANVPGAAARLALLRQARRVLADGGLATFSVHDRALTEPMVRADEVVARGPGPGDLVVRAEEDGVPCYFHYFDRDEVEALCRDAGFASLQIQHTSDLGQQWGNVFVVTARSA